MATHPDWMRHEYAFRLMGRLTYSPEIGPESWQPLSRRKARRGGPLLRSGARRRQPHPAAGHPDARTLDRQQLLLARDLHQHVGYRHLPAAAGRLRHGRADPLRQRALVRSRRCSPTPGSTSRPCSPGPYRPSYTPLDIADWLDGFAGEAEAALADLGRTPEWSGRPVAPLCRGYRDHGRASAASSRRNSAAPATPN